MAKDTAKQRSEAAAVLGRKGGPARAKVLTEEQRKEIASKGGQKFAANLTPEQRIAIGKRLAKARAAKKKLKKGA
jgi:general stress protein YciG